MSAAQQLDAIAARIAALRTDGGGSVTTLSNEARASTELLGALPPRYGEVLLSPLDSSRSSRLSSTSP